MASPVRAGTLLELETAVDALRTDTTEALGEQASDILDLEAATKDNGKALTAQADLLKGLRTDLGGFGTDVASLKVEVGELRGLIGELPEILGPNGPLDLPGILEKLNTETLANTTSLANVNVNLTALQTNVVTQVARIDDHDRRITANTNDIARHEHALGDLQAEMANGFAGIRDELRDHDRRIDKATQGVAMAFAMKSPAVPENKNFAVSGSFGAYENKTALAFAGGVRASNALQFDAGLAVGLDEGTVGGRAGATLAW